MYPEIILIIQLILQFSVAETKIAARLDGDFFI